ncbi:cobalamin biosynthesis protein [Trichormus variabilis ARAD]|uniref:Cobalamin biosynthesis protein n=1 Tax=Trichormus variabilis N2B TaxID=2681315 RepID=A0ABR6S263_ANAVA|nr:MULTISPECIES: cobalamin biosynthesis protein [Nostocaceae]MBC1215644.1 cobalamin biosynthesis protein [Trichormus variabilis ARAD]MBC1257397.1 cobalamin biosynthesis protein [Trichormus variabilis V5]MBC1266720.1 cobalamin biosynthesis protein [Trichormus variabilis FSR]MBC1300485.1 cobalamin biosynthesis protein [Trichormus variabilis N2B]MBC1310450.1 cobalamin biosynthesis protein [Trichormus variabilis PNB]
MKLEITQQPLLQGNLWLGFGCQSGISHHLITAAINQIFPENQLDQKTIAGIATIDTKVSELGLVEFCRLLQLPLKTFPAEMLANVAVPNPSGVIAEKVGTPSVAEAAAILAASAHQKQESGVKLLVPKRIFRLPGQPGVVAIAVAQA